MKLYIVRHAESEANTRQILAGQMDFPLSPRGVADASHLASTILENLRPEVIYCSPLIRAIQTALPYAMPNRIPLTIDERIIEQDIGIFAGKTYPEVEADPRYENDRSKRWKWVPPSGESYEQISHRLVSFFSELPTQGPDCLIVTHAVTMRVMRGLLENTLPAYQNSIPKNGEVWEISFQGIGYGHPIKSHLSEDLVYRDSRA